MQWSRQFWISKLQYKIGIGKCTKNTKKETNFWTHTHNMIAENWNEIELNFGWKLRRVHRKNKVKSQDNRPRIWQKGDSKILYSTSNSALCRARTQQQQRTNQRVQMWERRRREKKITRFNGNNQIDTAGKCVFSANALGIWRWYERSVRARAHNTHRHRYSKRADSRIVVWAFALRSLRPLPFAEQTDRVPPHRLTE